MEKGENYNKGQTIEYNHSTGDDSITRYSGKQDRDPLFSPGGRME